MAGRRGSNPRPQGNEIGGESDVEDVSTRKEVVPYCGSMYFGVFDEWLYGVNL
jgi:hypothetical protein